MAAYYNEIDPYAAAWLRNLIAAGHIPPGDVDERSIVDVDAHDLYKYTQAHFFAGIAGWAYALRLAGWPDDQPVWTGSCPCQPFSVAGKGKAQSDDRHLWPAWFNLIKSVKPPVLFGEQVVGAIAHGWLDDAFDDLEGQGYETAAAVLPACSVGAPHKRDRLWFVGYAELPRPSTAAQPGKPAEASDYDTKRQKPSSQLTGTSRSGSGETIWPTPRATKHNHQSRADFTPNLAARVIQAEGMQTGTLNPAFVAWLMGYPPEHLNCAPMAMPSSRKSRRSS